MHKHHPLPARFAEIGLKTPLLRALDKVGYQEPTEIQEQVIPLILGGKDVFGQARTGTGKTAAFGLPIIQMIHPEKPLQAITLVPTRELAVQVAAELTRLGEFAGVHVVPVYGGQRISHQLHRLGKKPHIVVGTPGRVLDLLGRGALAFGDVRFAVLDEVDRMLDIGFRDDIQKILSHINKPHQTTFMSATLTDEIKRLAARYTQNPVEVDVSRDDLTVEHVAQSYVTVEPWDKFEVLRRLIMQQKPPLAIIFCNTKHNVRRTTKRLHGAGIDAREIHGDLLQQKRDRVMEQFRRHKLNILVATDLAARGIDVKGISHIINYDLPEDAHIYVHRIGRTARMGSFGKAVSFVTREQGALLTEIEMLINKEVPQEKVEGFVPRPAREEAAPEPVPARPVSRLAASVHGPDTPATKAGDAPRSKRLGAKFKPARRRRRL